MKFKGTKGITLVALVVTIIILLLLAGITISSLTGSGLFEKTQEAKRQSEIARIKEEIQLNIYEKQLANLGSLSDQDLENILGKYGAISYEEDGTTVKGITTEEGYEILLSEIFSGDTIVDDNTGGGNDTLLADGSWNGNVNSPKLMEGMTGVYWDNNGTKTYVTAENQDNWYDYSTTNKKWANAETEDGSLWVWIPRYEYKITNQTIDVKFIPTTQEEVDSDYTYIHPAFQDGSESGKNNNYANGEWNAEIPGFWVAKFPAGYAGGGKNDTNNDVAVVDSGEKYSGTTASSNYYGSITSGTTTMKYPVFMGQTYAYNYINVGDSYKLAKSLTKANNPYGLNNTKTDSHQMKNSEWGAVEYLTHSQYGLNGQNLLNINNVNLNNTVSRIYAVTGYAGEGTDTSENKFTTAPETLGVSISAGTYTSHAWYTANGQKGSSTQNITGVYDLSGCVWERTSVYIENSAGASSRSSYGGNLISETDLKYKTIYPHNSSSDSNANNWTAYKNAQTAIYGYGDAILETSTAGSGSNSWNGDYSSFPYSSNPFFVLGGSYYGAGGPGVFAFGDSDGSAYSYSGFRVVLVGV